MNIEEIENEIGTLEQSDTNWANIQKLSWLYIVRNNLCHEDVIYGTSEISEAVRDKPLGEVMEVLSEHMDVIKTLHPKEYRAVIDKIRGL